jgi:putative ABC transport system permease protein
MTMVRQLVRSLDPARPLFGVRSVDEIIGASLDQPRLNARFLTAFAAAALALAALGLYGLLTLLVAQRRRELGVRMALGASPRDLVRLILTGAGRLIAFGIVAGVILTVAAGTVLRGLLFGVTAHDPRAIAGGILALTVVSALAIAIPARQAAAVDPIEAMRGE